jgi:hypothetical protein
LKLPLVVPPIPRWAEYDKPAKSVIWIWHFRDGAQTTLHRRQLTEIADGRETIGVYEVRMKGFT